MAKTIWLFGLPCSGKTTIAKKFCENHPEYIHLDGDEIREYINTDLGFATDSRIINIARIAKMAQFLNMKGYNVIVSAITPYECLRTIAKGFIKNLKLVFCDCSISVCKKRDIKGMYKKAAAGEIENFTGVSDDFERPKNSDIYLPTDLRSLEDCVKTIEI